MARPFCCFVSFLIRWGILAVLISAFALIRTGVSDDDHLAALKIADRYVQRKKALSSDVSGAVSAAIAKSLLGRYYRVGDTWEVAAYSPVHTQARKVDDPEQLREDNGVIGIFKYKVTKVTSGFEPEVVIEVTQKERFGIKVVDPRVECLTLKINDRMSQNAKSYTFRSQPRNAVGVPARGIRSKVSRLEFFPLDVPDMGTAARGASRQMPEVPVPLRAIAARQAIIRMQTEARGLTRMIFLEGLLMCCGSTVIPGHPT